MRAGLRKRSLRRMDEITSHYARQSGVLAVAAFGSNAERERFDDSSDLDRQEDDFSLDGQMPERPEDRYNESPAAPE